MKKAVIFDLDGTLWDSAYQIVNSWNETFAANGIDKSIAVWEMKSLMGKPMEAIIDSLVPDIDEDRRRQLLKDCCDREQKLLAAYGGILFPDLCDMLTRLRDRGYHLSIVSNCQAGYIETFIEYHKMGAYFDDWECPGNSGLLKADNIKLVMERNNIEKAVYVGDTQGDLDACRWAGVPFIFARYGFGHVDDESHAIDSLNELSDMVERMMSE